MTQPTIALTDLPATRRSHFRLSFYGAVFRLVHTLRGLGDQTYQQTCEKFPFLNGYLQELRRFMPDGITWADGVQWWASQVAAWEEQAAVHLPLRALSGATGAAGRAMIMLIGLVEEDSRFGTLFAYLQQPVGQRRPTLELAGRLLAGETPADAWAICRPLVTSGAVEVLNPHAPRAEWELAVPGVLWDVLQADDDLIDLPWCRYTPPERLRSAAELVLPESVQRQLAQVPALFAAGKARTFVVRGMRGSERTEALGAVAHALGWGLLAAEGPALAGAEGGGRLLGPLCTMTRCLPVLSYDLGPGETVTLPDLPGYTGPLGVVLGAEGGLRGRRAEQSITLTLPAPGLDLRRRHWEQALAGHPTPDLDLVAARFHMPGGYIRQAGRMAVAQAALDGREEIALSDIRVGCRSLNRQMLDTLATRLEPRGTWADLVVSDITELKLRELELRCRYRERLLDHLNPVYDAGGNRGVRALLNGPSGTGKTMAARTLAAALGMDIYRVDLAAVVNKYIGETEKNLNQVLSRAEELDVILLLDEGDALLSKRSDVKSSNDRYANLETNYLLQRLEAYQGIVLVTTNAGDNIDQAFRRRMDVVVNFLPPQADERLRIWERHLPGAGHLDQAALEEIAIRCAMTGGQIRNAAMHATLLALDGGGPITAGELAAAVQSEYRKSGAISPLGQGEEPERPAAPGGIAAFLDGLGRGRQ